MENTNTESTVGVSIGHLEPISVEPPVEKLVRGDLIAVNNDYSIEDLEVFAHGRNRARGLLKTPSFEDFKSFVDAVGTFRYGRGCCWDIDLAQLG